MEQSVIIHNYLLDQPQLFCAKRGKHTRLKQYEYVDFRHGVSQSTVCLGNLSLYFRRYYYVLSEQKIKLLKDIERAKIALSKYVDFCASKSFKN